MNKSAENYYIVEYPLWPNVNSDSLGLSVKLNLGAYFVVSRSVFSYTTSKCIELHYDAEIWACSSELHSLTEEDPRWGLYF